MSDLGKISVTNEGDWNASTPYEINTMVRHNGATYMSLKDSTGQEPSEENTEYWSLISKDGATPTVDSELSDTSINPVQNKVVKNALDGKSDTTHNHDGTYLKSVPIATKDTLGVIKVGTGLSVTNDGTLSADAQAVNVTPAITQNSDEAVSSGAVFSRIGNLKFVVKTTPPTSADNNTFTIVVPN